MYVYVAVVVALIQFGRKYKVSNKETQTINEEEGHLIATARHMSNHHAHVLHLHMWWPYYSLHWSVVVFHSHRWNHL